MGIMLLVLTPVPVCRRVSRRLALSRQVARACSSARAGICVELFIAALGVLRLAGAWSRGSCARSLYNVMVVAGVSHAALQRQPAAALRRLLRARRPVEIPNLGARANRYLGYLVQRYALAVKDADSPAETLGERVWMALYGIAAFVYRASILFVIIVFIAGKFFIVGVLLAMWALGTQVFTPVGKSVSYLASNPGLRRQRGQAVGKSVAIASA